MSNGRPAPLVITGATGRIGRMVLAGAEGRAVIRAGRRAGPGVDLVWDLEGAAPALPQGAVILHLAARLAGQDLVSANVAMVRGVLRAAQACDAARVLIASSAAVYGVQERDCREDGPVRPVSEYGRAKLASEAAARALAGRVPVSVLRISNVPGADALLGQGRSGIVSLDPVAGSAAGPVRSWIGPARLAEVILTLAGETGALPAVLNVASDPPLAMGDLLTAAGIGWQFGPARAGAVARVVLCTRRLQALLPQGPVTAAGLVAEWRALQARAA